MTIYKVITSLKIDGNTSIIIEGNGDLIKNGTGILDSQGRPHEVLSVGMPSGSDVKALLSNTALLINGDIETDRIYV